MLKAGGHGRIFMVRVLADRGMSALPFPPVAIWTRARVLPPKLGSVLPSLLSKVPGVTSS